MVIRGGPLGDPLGIRGQLCCGLWKKVWPIGGLRETAIIPDEPDVLDGGDVVDGVGGGGGGELDSVTGWVVTFRVDD